MERKLATIRKIVEIQPIDGADKIVRARVDDWWVVTAIDNGFNVGDLVVYLEIDSFVPHSIAPFLSKGKEPREFEGVQGERLRTIRLRGQLSQGMILPLSVLRVHITDMTQGDLDLEDFHFDEGQDVTAALGILKWEAPINAQLQGKVRGNFPSFLRKSDQERVQNVGNEIFGSYYSDEYEVSMKFDGSSMTVYHYNDNVVTRYGVCSRNMDLELEQDGNTFVDTTNKINIIETLKQYGKNIAIQGELMGEGIQGNREKIQGHEFFVYNIFDIDKQRYVSSWERQQILNDLLVKHGCLLKHVPIINANFLFNLHGVYSVQDLLALADNQKSMNHEYAEGLVFKSNDTNFSFKVISNKFLEREK